MRQQKKEILLMNFVKVYDKKLIFSKVNVLSSGYRKERSNDKRIINNAKYTGMLRSSGRKKIEERVQAWVNAIRFGNQRTWNTGLLRKHMPVMITLTLPAVQMDNDKKIKKEMLQLFLKNLKNNYKTNNWLWRAEKQKNGNIHFHIIVDKYVDKKGVAEIWHRVCDNKGYMQLFFERFGHRNPPSVKITGTKKQMSPAAYLMKYVSKESDEQVISGAVWGCSDSLKKFKLVQMVVDGSMRQYIEQLMNNKLNKVVASDWWGYVGLKNGFDYSKIKGYFADEWKRWFGLLYDELCGYSEKMTVFDEPLKQYNYEYIQTSFNF